MPISEPLPAFGSGKGCDGGGAGGRSVDLPLWMTREGRRECLPSSSSRKEVIQPQVPLRLPCYDFTPVADLTVAGLRRLRVKPTPMV